MAHDKPVKGEKGGKNSRPVHTRHLGDTVYNLCCFGPLQAERIVFRLRV